MQGYIRWSLRALWWCLAVLLVVWMVLWLWFLSLGSSGAQFLSPFKAALQATLGTMAICLNVGLLWLIGLAIAYWGDVQRQTR